jgi:hypothetical protein
MLFVTHRENFPPDAVIDEIPGLREQFESHLIPDASSFPVDPPR